MNEPDRFEKLREKCKSKPHGTRARYSVGCHCDLCRAANNAYEKRRNKLRRTFDFNGIVPADRAREHLVRLSRDGVGRHSVQAVSGVSDTILFAIIKGTRRQIRARTERRILAVEADAARSDKALVNAGGAWRKIRALLDQGYTRRFIARQLGSRAATPALQLDRHRITWKNANAVERLYRNIQAGKVARP
jgi:hypothetical protein